LSGWEVVPVEPGVGVEEGLYQGAQAVDISEEVVLVEHARYLPGVVWLGNIYLDGIVRDFFLELDRVHLT
jgi:hypothetical protein